MKSHFTKIFSGFAIYSNRNLPRTALFRVQLLVLLSIQNSILFLSFSLLCFGIPIPNILRSDFIMLEECRALLVAYFPTGQMPLVTPLVTCSIPLLVSFLALFAHYNDGLCRPAGTRPQHTPAKSILVLSKIFSSNPKVCPGVYEEHSQMDRNPFPTYANGSHHHDPVRYHLLLESQLKGVRDSLA